MSTKKRPAPISPGASPPDRPFGAGPIAGASLRDRLPTLVEAWRGGRGPATQGGSALGAREIDTAGAALLSLQRGLTGGRELAGAAYMDDRALLGAYLLYYWPVSYMQVSIALAEFPFSPRRILDLGSGPGPASAAVIDAAPSGSTVESLVLVDRSRKSLDLAAAIIGRGARVPAALATARLDLETAVDLPAGPFDLIIMGHCLNELWKGEADALRRRAEFLERASGRLSPGGRLLLVEPALLATSRGLIGLRDMLAARSWRVLGPCPGSYPCPALAAGPERSCHAESPWAAPEPVASLAKEAGLDRTAVKFSFFFLSPPTRAGTPPEERPPENRRVVSDPMLNKAGRIRFILCGGGMLETLSARADDEGARARGFMGLGRGDVVRASSLELRQGGGFGLLPGSELEILSRAPEASAPKEDT